jgi:hypothetical protein
MPFVMPVSMTSSAMQCCLIQSFVMTVERRSFQIDLETSYMLSFLMMRLRSNPCFIDLNYSSFDIEGVKKAENLSAFLFVTDGI